MIRHLRAPIIVLLCLIPWGCRAQPPGAPTTAVTTSYLECAVRDLLGDEVEVASLAPPGSCPGHFDPTPSDVRALSAAALFLRFDFQSGVDAKLAPLVARGLLVHEVFLPEGMCVPEVYAAACRSAVEGLAQAFPERSAGIEDALTAVEARMQKLALELRGRVERAGLTGAPVVASGHQAEFCRTLGLTVAATYSGGDEETVRALKEMIKAGDESSVRVVVANLQEGTARAEALAERLAAPVVVFSNFPAMTEGEDTFDELARNNVARLVGVLQ